MKKYIKNFIKNTNNSSVLATEYINNKFIINLKKKYKKYLFFSFLIYFFYLNQFFISLTAIAIPLIFSYSAGFKKIYVEVGLYSSFILNIINYIIKFIMNIFSIIKKKNLLWQTIIKMEYYGYVFINDIDNGFSNFKKKINEILIIEKNMEKFSKVFKSHIDLENNLNDNINNKIINIDVNYVKNIIENDYNINIKNNFKRKEILY